MNPKDYYYQQFRTDFAKFWERVPHRDNYVTGEPLFKFAGLVKSGNLDSLESVARENLVYFLSALGCTILTDQVIYTHFRNDYDTFQEMTRYPKMWVGWINANPWMVFHQNVRLPRKLDKGGVVEKFSEFAEFFIADLKEFFKRHNFSKASWEGVRTAMLNDPDVVSGEFGEVFAGMLKKLN